MDPECEPREEWPDTGDSTAVRPGATCRRPAGAARLAQQHFSPGHRGSPDCLIGRVRPPACSQDSIHSRGQNRANIDTGVRKQTAARGCPRSLLHLSVSCSYSQDGHGLESYESPRIHLVIFLSCIAHESCDHVEG